MSLCASSKHFHSFSTVMSSLLDSNPEHDEVIKEMHECIIKMSVEGSLARTAAKCGNQFVCCFCVCPLSFRWSVVSRVSCRT